MNIRRLRKKLWNSVLHVQLLPEESYIHSSLTERGKQETERAHQQQALEVQHIPAWWASSVPYQ